MTQAALAPHGKTAAEMNPSRTFADRLGHRLRDIVTLGGTKRYQPDEPLMVQGDRGDFVIIIQFGTVKVSSATDRGQQRLLAFRGPGDLVGEMACINGSSRSATVTAHQSEVVGIRIAGTRFTEYLNRNSDVAMHVTGQLIERLLASQRQIEFANRKVIARLAHRLSELAGVYGRSERGAVIPIRQDELAELVGASQVSANREMRKLQEWGLIVTGYGKVTVPCRQCLANVAVMLTTDLKIEPANGCGGEIHQPM